MKQLLLIFIAALFITSCEQTQFTDLEYTLVWQDEFQESSINENNWNFDLGTGCESGLYGWGNNESQYYQKENASIVSNDYLQIEARDEYFAYEDCNGNSNETFYTSAKVHTKEKFDFTYGRIEASIKMDPTRGLWHAFWMLPSFSNSYWPKSGEVDIMENYTNSEGVKKLINNLIFELGSFNASVTENDSISILGSYFDEFHTYSIEWDRASFSWFIDGVYLRTVYKKDSEALENSWPFNESFHLILNTAIGGNLGGDVINVNSPQYMLVDYVRVYQKK